jgi:fumarylacetoacetase
MAFGSESIAELLMPQTKLQNNAKDLDIIIFRMEDVEMQLPVLIGDYTDFTLVKNTLQT